MAYENSNRKKLLAINFGGIGDEILFLPTLETIRRSSANLSITLLCEPRSRSVEQLTDLIDEVVTFDIKKRPLMIADLLDLMGLIRDGAYDCIVSSGSSPMVSALLFLSGVRERIGYGTSKLSRLLLTEPVPLKKEQYAGDMYHDLALGYLRRQKASPATMPASASQQLPDSPSQLPDSAVPKIVLNKGSLNRMKEFLNDHKTERTVLIHPGTSRLATQKGIIKTWPTEKWIELLSLLTAYNNKAPAGERITTILAGGPDDKEIIDSILASPDLPPNLVSAYGRTKNIADLAALIELTEVLICVDSAPMHVSIGLNHPTVALFGPFNPAFLVPDESIFHTIWDKRDGKRHMFDRLGVVIAARAVFEELLQALPKGKTAASI